jgi:hypothetical protein
MAVSKRAKVEVDCVCQGCAMVKRVLVIVSGKSTAEPANWYNIFSGCTLASGEPVEVDQSE